MNGTWNTTSHETGYAMKFCDSTLFAFALGLWTFVYAVLYVDCRYDGKLQAYETCPGDLKIVPSDTAIGSRSAFVGTFFKPAIVLEEAVR